MSTVDDLVTWLRAQLDDDERVAREAAHDYPNWDTTSDGNVVQVGTGGSGYIADGPWDGDLFEIGVHMARHDPARVLAEVDAKRRILDYFEYERVDVSLPWGPPTTVPGKRPATAGPVLRLLALPYANRPGYRDEWAPTSTSA